MCAFGSGGTQAGLVAGLATRGSRLPGNGIGVSGASEAQNWKIHALASETAARIGIPEMQDDSIVVVDGYAGAGYAIATDGMIEAVRLFAELEGILLDPLYTGKAAAGLIGMIRKGQFRTDSGVLFLHTGGSVGPFDNAPLFLG